MRKEKNEKYKINSFTVSSHRVVMQNRIFSLIKLDFVPLEISCIILNILDLGLFASRYM